MAQLWAMIALNWAEIPQIWAMLARAWAVFAQTWGMIACTRGIVARAKDLDEGVMATTGTPSSFPFVLVTGNAGKIAEARLALGGALEAIELDLPEIQSLDLAVILRGKADAAWRQIGRPLVIEDVSLELSALNGFPGPLIKWMLQALGAEGLARTARTLGDTRAAARCGLLYRDAERIVAAEGVTEGDLILPGRGDQGFGWDPVFLPRGETRTFAQLAGKEKDAVSHRGKAWRELMRRLGER
jgi:XTP/dITP diphosphohydrolase